MRHVVLHWAGIAGAVACILLMGWSCSGNLTYADATVAIRAEGTADQVKKFDIDVRGRFPNRFKCYQDTATAALDCTPGISGQPTALGYVFYDAPKEVMSKLGDIFDAVTLSVGPAAGCPVGCTCNPGCPGFHAPYCMKNGTHCTACP